MIRNWNRFAFYCRRRASSWFIVKTFRFVVQCVLKKTSLHYTDLYRVNSRWAASVHKIYVNSIQLKYTHTHAARRNDHDKITNRHRKKEIACLDNWKSFRPRPFDSHFRFQRSFLHSRYCLAEAQTHKNSHHTFCMGTNSSRNVCIWEKN